MTVEACSKQRASPAGIDDDRRTHDLTMFYREMLPRIYGYILLRVRNDRATAEDITQETFLAYARNQRDEMVIANPTGWLFGTARFKVIDFHRRRVRTWEEPLQDDEANIVSTDDGAELDHILDRQLLSSALDHLSDIQRIVILLRYVDDLSVRTIATHLDKTEHAIEAHLVRARRTLRTILIAGERP